MRPGGKAEPIPAEPETTEQPDEPTGELFELEPFLSELEEVLAGADSDEVVAEVWDSFDVEATLTGDEDALQRAFDLKKALGAAPAHIKTILTLARYQGFRGQTCAALLWGEYVSDAQFGKAFRMVIRKNGEPVWFPAAPETKEYLASIERTSVHICTHSGGAPYKGERNLQKAVSDWLKTLKKEGHIRKGCTLHGLRVTFAASIRRRGYGDEEVADALGDKSRAMGRHYTRHVERQATLIDIFTRKNVVQND